MSNLDEAIKHIEAYAESERQLREQNTFDPAGVIHVTVAGDYSLGISKDDRLIYFPNNSRRITEITDLGSASLQNIESLEYALKRLKIHTIKL
jgi:hypothetical protein